MDFINAIRDDQYIFVVLCGKSWRIHRARLGTHLQLIRVMKSLGETTDPVFLSAHILEYMSISGVSDDLIKKASSLELFGAFLALERLNRWTWVLPWIDPNRMPEGEKPQAPDYDYAGRSWALWIHQIAVSYGWSRSEILNLWPEEAAAYIQEIMLDDYLAREQQRSLSQVSYKYIEELGEYKFIESPKPQWMVDPEAKQSVRRIPIKNLPKGLVLKA